MRRSATVVALCTLLARPAVSAQVSDSTIGSVVRVSTFRTGATDSRSRSQARAGLLVRRRGDRQRIDMLTAIGDASGTEWMTVENAPFSLRINNVAQKNSIVMRFEDLKTVFTSLLSVRFDSVQTEADVLGAGPRVLGYETQRVRIQRRFRMRTARAGKSQVVRVSSESDALIAPSLPEDSGANTALALTSDMSSAMLERIFGPGAGEMVVRGGRMPSGLVLRTVSRTRTVSTGANLFPLGPNGAGLVAIDSIEVVSIERMPLPDSLFVAPADYTPIDFSVELRKLVAALDELGSASGDAKGNRKPTSPKAGGKPFKP